MNDLAAGCAEAAPATAAPFAIRGLLLPNQPLATPSAAQAALTAHYLQPAQAELEAFFLALRALVDPDLQRSQPVKLGKPYPMGQCLEITLAVQQRLRRVELLPLSGMAAQGRAAFLAFMAAGGALRQVWGDLRGEFFQNAFQLGTLYVDVSNDTVTPTKLKVEILPFDQAQFVPIADFEHFARIAERYWKDRVYPNHVLPGVAPYCPLVHINPQGVMQLRAATDYMVALATAGRFGPSESVLRAPAMSAAVFDAVARALQGSKLKLAASAEAGRTQALRLCRDYRTKRWYQSQEQTAKIIQTVQRANVRLAQWGQSISQRAALPQPHTTTLQDALPMPKITIDNREFDTDDLSQEVNAQLEMLVACENKLRELQRDVMITQTARNAYANAVKVLLPTPLEAAMAQGDTLKLG